MATVDELRARLAAQEQLIAQLREAQLRASEIQLQLARQDPEGANAAALTYLRQNEGLPVLATVPTPGANQPTPSTAIPQTQPESIPPDGDAAIAAAVQAQRELNIETELGAGNGIPLPPEVPEDPEIVQARLATAAQQAADLGPGEYLEAPPTVDSGPEYDQSIAENSPEAQAQLQALLLAQQQEGAAIAAGIAVARNTGSITPFTKAEDWRLRLSLAPSADYLYAAATQQDILYPLRVTNGVIFPYTPQINITYSATYDSTDLTHTNYKHYNYKNSSVENINITADFTAQDTQEANYLLAVIHFFRSVTKMFYGKDVNPIKGVPPPLCYLSGYGTFGFDNHPVAVTTFTYNLPNDVDFINAGPGLGDTGAAQDNRTSSRLHGARLRPGGLAPQPKFTQNPASDYNTRVPTKIQIILSCIPIVSRRAASNYFSLAEYATGKLLRGSKNSVGGGYW
jgi:hypothetical protein